MKKFFMVVALGLFVTCITAGCEENIDSTSDTTNTDPGTGGGDGDTDADADNDADADADSDTETETSDTEADTATAELLAKCQVIADDLDGRTDIVLGYTIIAEVNVELTVSEKTCVIAGDFLLFVLRGTDFPFDNDNGEAWKEDDGSIVMERDDGLSRTYINL